MVVGEIINKMMPMGIENFKEVRENYYFVDKTDFIRELIDTHSKVTLITRPRRFGKTLTMSMLEYFFSVDRAEESKYLFQGLAIEKAGTAYMNQQGKYPVIFLTLKNVQNDTWQGIYKSFRLLIQKEFQKHDYVLCENLLRPSEKAFYQRIMNLVADEEEYQTSILNLSSYLYRYFGVKPIILIDEYDAPIQYAYDYGFYDTAISYFRNWFNNTLKGNETLHFAVLTGVLRIAKESIFSGLNNLDVYTVLDEQYSDAIGFTPEEVNQMAQELHKTEYLPQLKSWYDGYRFGFSEIYNPWSINNFFKKNEIDDYWIHTSENSILKYMLNYLDSEEEAALLLLLHGGSITAVIRESVIYDDIGQDADALYTMLLTTGYLTVIHKEKDFGGHLCELTIPNREVKNAYRIEILEKVKTKLSASRLIFMMRDLMAGRVKEFSKTLERYIGYLVSSYDVANKESFYHGFLLGMTALFVPNYTVESNRESGYGRFDLAIFPKDKANAGVLMEFKVAETEAHLGKKAEEALEQIEKRQYNTEFSKRGVKVVWKYGIAFCGKQICVKMKE